MNESEKKLCANTCINYNHILNCNIIKDSEEDLFMEKIKDSKEFIEYKQYLKNNNIFKIYIKWLYYTLYAHKYLIISLCILNFLFNFLYISFFIIYNIFIYDIKSSQNFYKMNDSFIILNSIILIFYIFLYFYLHRIILKILNLFGYLLITFVSFSLILFLYSTSYFHISLYDNTYIIYTIIFYLFLFIPNVSLFLFSINYFHTIHKGLLLGVFTFIGNLGFVSYTLFRFIIQEQNMTLYNLIFSCVICIISCIFIILFIPQINSCIDFHIVDHSYFNHFLLYGYNKKKVSPLFTSLTFPCEISHT
ncbi:hypothetical protein PFNF135_03829 [Plasmodium falciparum NF135/5.C10]|nr:hypothetical protein PFNF135_03829 [Plasmodium falciparum NF135/5.C10]